MVAVLRSTSPPPDPAPLTSPSPPPAATTRGRSDVAASRNDDSVTVLYRRCKVEFRGRSRCVDARAVATRRGDRVSDARSRRQALHAGAEDRALNVDDDLTVWRECRTRAVGRRTAARPRRAACDLDRARGTAWPPERTPPRPAARPPRHPRRGAASAGRSSPVSGLTLEPAPGSPVGPAASSRTRQARPICPSTLRGGRGGLAGWAATLPAADMRTPRVVGGTSDGGGASRSEP